MSLIAVETRISSSAGRIHRGLGLGMDNQTAGSAEAHPYAALGPRRNRPVAGVVRNRQPLIPRPGRRLLAGQRGESLLKTIGVIAGGLKDVRQGILGRAADFHEI